MLRFQECILQSALLLFMLVKQSGGEGCIPQEDRGVYLKGSLKDTS